MIPAAPFRPITVDRVGLLGVYCRRCVVWVVNTTVKCFSGRSDDDTPSIFYVL
jgi:hypothetical protein